MVSVACGVVEMGLECGAVCRGVVGEEVPPGGVDALAVGEVLLVDLVDEPLIGSESALRHSSRVVAQGRFGLASGGWTGVISARDLVQGVLDQGLEDREAVLGPSG